MGKKLTSFFFIFFSSVSYSATVMDLVRDAQASLFYGDFFHAYRTFNYLEQENKTDFSKVGIEGYLQSLFIVGSNRFISSECERLGEAASATAVAKVDYLCGRHFVEKQKAEQAESFLRKITQLSKLYWPAQILRASSQIIANSPQRAIDLLKSQEIKQYAALGLGDEFYLTTARAYAAENKLDEALKNYQQISGKSPFYIEAIEETAWVFFKMHKFESAQVLLDVLIGNYESSQKPEDSKVSQSTFYRARYLRAYLALSEKRTEGASIAFNELKQEYEKSLQKLRPVFESAETLKSIRDQNIKWTDIRNIPEKLKSQIKLIGDWEGPAAKKEIESEIFFQMALSREINRTQKFKDVLTDESSYYGGYLNTLQQKTWPVFADKYEKTIKKLAKDMETLRVKAEVGRLEIVWLRRAEGARSLDEVIDNYRQEVRSIDEFMEK